MTRSELLRFQYIIQDIIYTPEFIKMRNTKHHIKTSLYDHSLKVAYLCYRFHCKHNLSINIEELVRAALLHDYFLYDRINKSSGDNINRFIHLFKHPATASYNAINDYPDLTYKEINAIKRHMFPIVPIPPTTKCGWIICYFDKIASIGDYAHNQKWKKELYSIAEIF